MIKLRIFVSSVQKELEEERRAVKAISKLKAEQAIPVFEVRPSVIETLTKNQKTIIRVLLIKKQIQVPDLAITLQVTEQAVRKDLAKLTKLKFVEKRGAARATYYVLREQLSKP